MTRQKLEQSSGKVTRLTTGVGYCHWLQPSDHLDYDDDEDNDDGNDDDDNCKCNENDDHNYMNVCHYA